VTDRLQPKQPAASPELAEHWPMDASTNFVTEAFDDAKNEECRVELEAGSQSMREFESEAHDRESSLFQIV
jgi:hypothetical protein